jgi:hypothetical protein
MQWFACEEEYTIDATTEDMAIINTMTATNKATGDMILTAGLRCIISFRVVIR